MTAALYKKWTEVYSTLVSPITSTRFMEKGQLTPEEFLEAGDKLVTRCPIWKWHGATKETEGVHKTMPMDKRYLVMTGARCEKRASDLTNDAGGEEEIEDGWTTTHIDYQAGKPEEAPDMEGDPADTPNEMGNENEEDIPEMGDDDDENGIIDEDDAAAATTTEGLVPSRKYDIHIMYDNYEYTPRVYLQGYDENGNQLTNEEMFQDIFADYKEKTATIEQHPYTGSNMVSIHPCRHAETMKRMIDKLREAHEARVAAQEGEDSTSPTSFGIHADMALFLFLKFISSVIPTIDYDYTTTVNI